MGLLRSFWVVSAKVEGVGLKGERGVMGCCPTSASHVGMSWTRAGSNGVPKYGGGGTAAAVRSGFSFQ